MVGQGTYWCNSLLCGLIKSVAFEASGFCLEVIVSLQPNIDQLWLLNLILKSGRLIVSLIHKPGASI